MSEPPEIIVLSLEQFRAEFEKIFETISIGKNRTPEVMTVAQIAEYLQISIPTIYKAMKERGLPYTEKCGDKRFIKSEVDTWLKS